MVGYLSSFVGETYVSSGDLDSYRFSSADGVLVLDGEVGKGSTLAMGSVVEMSIFGYCISSSYSPSPKSFLELSF
jgi:hypothetical protein